MTAATFRSRTPETSRSLVLRNELALASPPQDLPIEEVDASALPFPPAPAPPGLRVTSGWRAFDDLRLVAAGRVLLADVGAAAGTRLLMGLLAGAVALDRDAVVVDGSNWLDVYRLGEAARERGLAKDRALESVRVARGFTAYQLQSIVEDGLPGILAEGGVGLVLAPGFPEMYLDEDLKRAEGVALATRALATLRALAREHAVPVVVSNSVLSPRARHPLRTALLAGADEHVGLFPAPGAALRVLVPRTGLSVVLPAPSARQRALSEFSEVAASERGPEGEFARHAPDARLKYAAKRAGELHFKQVRKTERTLEEAFGAPEVAG